MTSYLDSSKSHPVAGSGRPAFAAPRRILTTGGVAAALLLGGIGAFGMPATSQAAVTSVHMDAAGVGLTAADGTAWSADSGFTGGRNGTVPTATVSGALGNTMLRTNKVGMTAWSAAVPNGTYKVTLAMNEYYWTAAGKRVFSATAEGTPIFTNLDVFASAGARVELDKSLTVAVTDGRIDIGFSAGTCSARVDSTK